MAKRVADRAIQVLGGYGYVGQYQVERLWRDSKLLEIDGGTNEAQRFKKISQQIIVSMAEGRCNNKEMKNDNDNDDVDDDRDYDDEVMRMMSMVS